MFRSLARRPPAFRFEKEIATAHDVSPPTGGDFSTAKFQRKFSSLLPEPVDLPARWLTPAERVWEREQVVGRSRHNAERRRAANA